MRLVVDNTAGGDREFAADVAQALRRCGLEVEQREAQRPTRFDTAVHLVTAGLAIRVSERPERDLLDTIERVVRDSLMHRPSLRRRTRSVPVQLGETGRVLEWIDVFD